MAEADTSRAWRVVWRMLRFGGGFVLGLLLVPGAWFALWFTADEWPPWSQSPSKPYVLTTSGADVSRAGGSLILIGQREGGLRQDCRDACDDLRLEDKGVPVASVRVLDAHGVCVACGETWNQTLPPFGLKHLSVAGAPKLMIGRQRHE